MNSVRCSVRAHKNSLYLISKSIKMQPQKWNWISFEWNVFVEILETNCREKIEDEIESTIGELFFVDFK